MNDSTTPRWLTPLYVMYGLGVIAFIAVLAWLLIPHGGDGPPQPALHETPFERALRLGTASALQACKPYATVEEKNEITTGLSVDLRKVAADGKTSRKTIEEAIDGTLSEPGKLHESNAARDCMVKQIADVLDRSGFVSKVGAVTPPSQQVLVDPATGNAAKGYIYVEELNGAATTFGPFVPQGSEKARPYAKLRADDVLEATIDARMRRGVGQATPLIGPLKVGACVKLLEDPSRPSDALSNATSGGHLLVASVKCPKVASAQA